MRVNNLNSLWKSSGHIWWSWSTYLGCEERKSGYWTHPFLLLRRVVKGLKDIVCTSLEGDRHLQAEMVGDKHKWNDQNQTESRWVWEIPEVTSKDSSKLNWVLEPILVGFEAQPCVGEVLKLKVSCRLLACWILQPRFQVGHMASSWPALVLVWPPDGPVVAWKAEEWPSNGRRPRTGGPGAAPSLATDLPDQSPAPPGRQSSLHKMPASPDYNIKWHSHLLTKDVGALW